MTRNSENGGLRPTSVLRVWLKHHLSSKGWNCRVHRESPGKFESTNLSGDNLSREIGHTGVRLLQGFSRLRRTLGRSNSYVFAMRDMLCISRKYFQPPPTWLNPPPSATLSGTRWSSSASSSWVWCPFSSRSWRWRIVRDVSRAGSFTFCCKRKCHYLEERPYHWIGIKVSVVVVSYSTGSLSTSTVTERTRHPTLVRLAARKNKLFAEVSRRSAEPAIFYRRAISISLSLSLCMYVHIYIYIYTHTYICLSISLSLSLSRCIYIYIYRERERGRERERAPNNYEGDSRRRRVRAKAARKDAKLPACEIS